MKRIAPFRLWVIAAALGMPLVLAIREQRRAWAGDPSPRQRRPVDRRRSRRSNASTARRAHRSRPARCRRRYQRCPPARSRATRSSPTRRSCSPSGTSAIPRPTTRHTRRRSRRCFAGGDGRARLSRRWQRSRPGLVAFIVGVALTSRAHGDDGSRKNSGAAEPAKDDATATVDAVADTALHDAPDAAETLVSDAADAPTAVRAFPPRASAPKRRRARRATMLATCASYASRARCEKVFPKEEPDRYAWVRSMLGFPTDAGSD